MQNLSFCRLPLDLIIKTVSLLRMSTTVLKVSWNHFPAWENLPDITKTTNCYWLKYLLSWPAAVHPDPKVCEYTGWVKLLVSRYNNFCWSHCQSLLTSTEICAFILATFENCITIIMFFAFSYRADKSDHHTQQQLCRRSRVPNTGKEQIQSYPIPNNQIWGPEMGEYVDSNCTRPVTLVQLTWISILSTLFFTNFFPVCVLHYYHFYHLRNPRVKIIWEFPQMYTVDV